MSESLKQAKNHGSACAQLYIEKLIKLAQEQKHPACIVGSINADHVITTTAMPRPGETVLGDKLSLLAGGKSANQAACAAKLGADIAMIGAVGKDSNGLFLLDELKAAGVNIAYIETVNQPTGATVIIVDQNGENSIVVALGANGEVNAQLVSRHEQAFAHSAAVGLCLEADHSAIERSKQLAHSHGATVLFNPSPMPEKLSKALLDDVDVLIVNEHELEAFIDTPVLDKIERNLEDVRQELNVSGLIVTRGARGSLVADANGVFVVEPIEVAPVDTTGCGDAFLGTLIAGRAANMSLVDSAYAATLVSAYAACGYGAQASYGTIDEIIAFAE